MNQAFQELFAAPGLRGVLHLSPEGQVREAEFIPGAEEAGHLRQTDWSGLTAALTGVAEADFVYARRKVHVLRQDTGCLVAVMEAEAPAALVRMRCQVAWAALRKAQEKSGGGLGRFFKFGR